MELLTPGIGLIFWQIVTFVALLVILGVFVWKPVTEALHWREGFINDSLKAAAVATKIKDDAKAETAKISERMIEDARKSINSEKQAAMKDVRNMVAELSLGIAEKVLRQNLSDDKSQKNLIEEYVKDINQN